MTKAKAKSAAPRKASGGRGSQQRSVETRQKIIAAAAHEFAMKGFKGASTRAISAAAGVQHTLVTYHFQTKEGLLRATLTRMSEERQEALEARLAGLRGVDSSTKLYLYLQDFIYFSAFQPDFAWIMSNVGKEPSPQLDWFIEHGIAAGFESIERLILAAQKANRFVEGEPKYLYYLFIGMATRIFMLSAEVEKVLGRSPFDPEFVEQHAANCLRLFFRNMPHIAEDAGEAASFAKV